MDEAYFTDIAKLAVKYTQSNSVMDFFHMELPEQMEALREFYPGEVYALALTHRIAPDDVDDLVLADIAYTIVNG